MESFKSLLGRMELPQPARTSNVIAMRRPTKPMVPPPTRVVDETMCSTCHNAGFTRNEFAGKKSVLIPPTHAAHHIDVPRMQRFVKQL